MAPHANGTSQNGTSSTRQGEMGKRPVRVANCSGYKADGAHEMYLQATLGDVDFITGDYLAEMNLAERAQDYAAGTWDGFEETAWEGLAESLEVLAEKGTKVVINGGSLNPKGLAEKVNALSQKKGLKLKVAYVSGDNRLPELLTDTNNLHNNLPKHLDSALESSNEFSLPENMHKALSQEDNKIVSANAYLGARAIVAGLRAGADIVICGRVSDASPVIGAAWYWHNWSDTQYDQLAGALVSGHLIECSAYVTGGNFSGFTELPFETTLHPGFPIAEIAADGSCVITKHEGTGGIVNTDTVRCQLLYELQGNIYLHSDSKAYLDAVKVVQEGKDRVHVSGIKGKAPPPTTKLAVFYVGGYQASMVVNATGYGTAEKWKLMEAQLKGNLKRDGILDKFDLLEFQQVGVNEPNPHSQLASTTYCRIFAEAGKPETLYGLLKAFGRIALRHFSGFHSALDFRTAIPKPFLGYFPALLEQNKLKEEVTLLTSDNKAEKTIDAAHPPTYEPLEARESYDTASAKDLSSFGRTKSIRLGGIALARSGDKGSNLNCGVFVKTAEQWEWLRSFLSLATMKKLMGDDWLEEYHLERVEFPNIFAVHFVVYGILGRGVSSSSRLDCLGKGFADYLRDKVVDVPESIL